MKKYFVLFACAVVVALMVAMFSGCSLSSSSNNISDTRLGVFDGECESFNATFVYGKRETPYKLDGVANNLVDFAIISVCFPSRIADDEVISYSLTAGTKTANGTLEKNPYTNEFMADTKLSISGSETVSLVLSSNNLEETTLGLVNRSQSWQVNNEKALEIGTSALKDEIQNFKDSGYEVQAKIVTQQSTNFGTYYWNISITSTSGKSHSVLVDVSKGEILVKN